MNLLSRLLKSLRFTTAPATDTASWGWGGWLPGAGYDYRTEAGRLHENSVVMACLKWQCRNFAESDEPLQPQERDHDLQNMNGLPLIDHVTVTGPFDPKGPGETPSRRRLFVCKPSAPADETACAQKILSTAARRAYRRPVSDADLATVMEMYAAGRKKGSFDTGIEQGLRLVLASPKFLFRTETSPATGSAKVTDSVSRQHTQLESDSCSEPD